MTPSLDPPQLDFKGLPLSIRAATVANNQPYWRIHRAIALNHQESGGNHNVYVRCSHDHQRLVGVMVRMFWPTGDTSGVTEAKPLEEWGDWNAPIYGDWHPEHGAGPYNVEVADGTPSEAFMGMGLPRNQHYSYIVEFERINSSTPTDPPTTQAFRQSLLNEAARQQVLRLNPQAALQAALFRDNFVPTSGEFTLAYEGAVYVCQRAERLSDGTVRAYYCLYGQWDNVLIVERP